MQHQDHDPVLIAGLAAGDLTNSEHSRAQALADTCQSCSQLRTDLIAIAAATRTLPSIAQAPRDFRLSADQAARLRRGSWLRSGLAPFGAARSAARPMAAAFTTLGLAGLLVATVLPGLFGSAASLGPDREQTGAGAPAPTAAPAAPVDAAGGPTAPVPNGPGISVDGGATARPGDGQFGTKDGVAPSVGPESVDGGRPVDAERVSGFQPLTALLVGSIAMLVIGLALFGLQIAGRRLRR